MRAPIDASERWRSWLSGGLTHVLGPLRWADAFAQREPLEFKGEAPAQRETGAQVSAAFSANDSRARVGGREGEAGISAEDFQGHALRNASSGRAFTAREMAEGAEESRVFQRPLPVESWPEPWKAAWAKTAFARPFLWSYERLGQDLMGSPSPERREALKKLLSRLGLGAAHNFWPFSEPAEQGGACLQPELFQEGLRLLAPKCVVFLGRDNFAGVTLPEVPEFYKVVSYLGTGALCVHLPDIQALGADEDLLSEAAAAFQQKLRHLI